MRLTEDQSRLLAAEVSAASARPEVAVAVADVYHRVQAEIDQRRPRCDISGRCCRFESYGHRLFVTTAELAAFHQQLRPDMTLAIRDWDGTGCPFQIAGRCGVHAIRPFGCRIFFCDPSSTQWQQDQYEQFHADLQQIHERLQVPYFYVEWREAIRAMQWEITPIQQANGDLVPLRRLEVPDRQEDSF
jgi:Fe-S-cluster containining protein